MKGRVRPKRAPQVLGFILKFKKEHDGNSPTIREISEGCKLYSTALGWRLLRELENEGLIHLMGGGKSRAIIVVGGFWQPPSPPVEARR